MLVGLLCLNICFSSRFHLVYGFKVFTQYLHQLQLIYRYDEYELIFLSLETLQFGFILCCCHYELDEFNLIKKNIFISQTHKQTNK